MYSSKTASASLRKRSLGAPSRRSSVLPSDEATSPEVNHHRVSGFSMTTDIGSYRGARLSHCHPRPRMTGSGRRGTRNSGGIWHRKRRHFLARHGRLYCEECHLDPVKTYRAAHGDACIEVHHARVSVRDMNPRHVTRFEGLQCLCANCHRIEHRRMRLLKRCSMVGADEGGHATRDAGSQ